MSRSAKKNNFISFSYWIQEILFFVFCFLILFLRIHPILILETHTPVFLKGAGFLYEFLEIPGGFVNWLSSLLMQFWFSDLISSISLTLCFWIVGLLTKKWIAGLKGNFTVHTFHLIPACLLLVLYGNYDFDLSAVLAIILNLFALVLIARWFSKQILIYSGLILALSLLLYWITGGAFLIFAVLCGLENILFKKKFISGLMLILISAIIPLAASKYVFLVTLNQAYLHNLTFENQSENQVISFCIPAFFLLTIIAVSLAGLVKDRKLLKKISRINHVYKWAIGTLCLLGTTVLLANESTDDIKKTVLQVNNAVSEERWTSVLDLTRHCPNETPLLSCQTNLALHNTGRLLDSMFAYPQSKGVVGLLMNQTWCLAWPREASNVGWRLGLVNESQHYAHEALERKGPTADLLKRLGMIYAAKGDYKAAKHFFMNLKETLFQEKTAEKLIQLNDNPGELSQDGIYNDIKSRMPVLDLVTDEKISAAKLNLLLERNHSNKMAFDYLIAYYLLSGNLREIINHFPDFSTYSYNQIPRHVQEAVLINAAFTPNSDPDQLKKWINPNYFNRFLEYRKIFMSYRGDMNSARYGLRMQFGDTYWYYLMFTKPGSLLPETQHEYQ